MTRKRRSERSGKRFKIAMRGCQPGMKYEGGYEFRVMSCRKILSLLLFAAFGFALITQNTEPLLAQTKTTVSDILHGPDGSLPSGQIVISSKSTFTASDGTVVFAGVVATATVANGSFSVPLVPNAGSTPAGTSYSAIYKLAGVPYKEETWVVPASASPVDLSTVRSATLSGPSQVLAPSQLPAVISTSSILDKGGQVFNVKAYGAKGDGATDDTSSVNAAFAAAYAAGGGSIYFPPGVYLIAGELVVPNDGAGQPRQPPYTLLGTGMGVDGRWATPQSNGSTLILTEATNPVGKIDTRGSGYLEISGISFKDTGSDSVPFIHSTNTTLHVHDCSFTSSQTGTANVQDAIVLGGNNPAHVYTADSDAVFSGYGTTIERNFFAQIRHAVVGNTYVNGVQVVNNTVGQGSGSSTAGDAPFIFIGHGAGSSANAGDVVFGNLIEMTGYYYGVRLDQYDENFTMWGNNAYDGGSNSTATYYLGTGSTTQIMSCGEVAPACVDYNSPGTFSNNYVAFTTTVDANGNGSIFGNNPYFVKGLTVRSGESLALRTIPGQETHIYEQSYSTYIQPNDGGAYDSIITHNGQWGILNTSPQAAFDVNGAVRTRPIAFASVPACGSANEGAMQAIADSSTVTWGAIITGGGANHVLGYCDGTAWTVAGK
jgi:hypothetical protein